MKEVLFKKIESVEKIATASKLNRLLRDPYKYLFAIFFKSFVHSRNKKTSCKTATLFFGKQMKINLPAGTDIYLTGGKSHPSEIRLAKFLILNLNTSDHFLDIGAHFGYFSLLASNLVGDLGRVYAFEPAAESYGILNMNIKSEKNITVFNKAVSDKPGVLTFYEFPNLYSEYNSTDVEQFKGEEWFSDFKPTKVEVEATSIDTVHQEGSFIPNVIKIDVEGAEYSVILGGRHFLNKHSPLLAMEYLTSARHNEGHVKAATLLRSLGYSSHIILASGQIEEVEDIDGYLVRNKLDSDNIVFKKK